MENDRQVTAEKIARSAAYEILNYPVSTQYLWDNCHEDEALYRAAYKAYGLLKQQLREQLREHGLFSDYQLADGTPQAVDGTPNDARKDDPNT